MAEYLQELRHLRRIRAPTHINTTESNYCENPYENYEEEETVDLSAYEGADEIDQELAEFYASDEEDAEEIDQETLGLLGSHAQEEEESASDRGERQTASSHLPYLLESIREEEADEESLHEEDLDEDDDEQLDLSPPITQGERPKIYGYIRNERTLSSSSSPSSAEPTSSNTNATTYGNKADDPIAIAMSSKNAPKPGPANLRPNSTPEEWLAESVHRLSKVKLN